MTLWIRGARIVAEGNSSEFWNRMRMDKYHTYISGLRIPCCGRPMNPNLYAVNCYLMEKNKQIDHVKTLHGIRIGSI